MKPEIYSEIFSETECLQADVLTAYTQHKLSADQTRAVEKHLAECGFCSDAVDALRESGDTSFFIPMVDNLNQRVDEKVKEQQKSKDESSGSGNIRTLRKNPFKFYRIAASIVMVFGVSALVFFNTRNSGKDNNGGDWVQNLRTEFDAIVGTQRSASPQDSLNMALSLINKSKVDEALAILENINHPSAPFYIASARAYKKDFEGAKEKYHEVIQSDMHVDEAKLLLAICYAATGDTKNAEKFFLQVSSPENDYSAAANKFLNQLRQK